MPRGFFFRLSRALSIARKRVKEKAKTKIPTPEIPQIPEAPSYVIEKEPQIVEVKLPQIAEKLNEIADKLKERTEEKIREERREERKKEMEEEKKMEEIKYEEAIPKGFTLVPVSLEITEEIEKPVEKEALTKLAEVNEVFTLVSLKYKDKMIDIAKGNIRWNPEENALVYYIIEPPLTQKENEMLGEIKELLRERLDIDFSRIRTEKAYSYLINKTKEIISDLGFKLNEDQILKFQYYIYRDFVGLGKIEALMHDPNIEDVSCDGVGIPVFIYHRNPAYAQIRTNIVFNTKEELDSFVLKLAQKCGKALSIAEPLLDGALPDGSRVHATLGTDIAMKGSNFTIRKFTERPMTPVDLMMNKTASPELFAYLWLIIETRGSVLIGGATATGKTSFLNALSLFIKPELKVITIEDTPELRLPLPNWLPEIARPGLGAKGYGEVSMFDLLKAALRQRPDYVIVGETRGQEAYVLFQGMATGHPGLSTLHADSLPAVIDRLTTKPIDLPKALLEHLDAIVFLILTRRENEYVRRVSEVVEIVGYDYKKNDIVTNVSFRWNPAEDKFVLLKSVLLDKIKDKMGMDVQRLRAELTRRVRLMNWMLKNKINDYREFARIISLYYASPSKVEELMKEEITV
jgi:flagellar protein FlaI